MLFNKSILIARSGTENEILANKLLSEGFSVIKIDLIKYKDLEFDIDIISRYEYVILTSKHACNIISGRNYPIGVNFLVVGFESANIMKSTINDIKIRSFNNVDEIINFIKILDKSKIIYLSGSVISKNIPNIARHIIYETEYQIKIDENIIEQIKFAQIDHVMIFSALNFKKLIHIFKTHDILSYIKYSVFICISKNLAEIVKKSSLQACYVEEPNQNNMIKLITQYERK